MDRSAAAEDRGVSKLSEQAREALEIAREARKGVRQAGRTGKGVKKGYADALVELFTILDTEQRLSS